MKTIKEVGYRCLILFVMISLTFVAYDMSKPALLSEDEMLNKNTVECIVQSFSTLWDNKHEEVDRLPVHGYNFFSDMLLPVIIYLISIGGFIYLLIEDFKMIRLFTNKNRLAKYLWILWIILLICLILIPIFFGMQLIMRSFALAVTATAIFLILTAILYRLAANAKTEKKP